VAMAVAVARVRVRAVASAMWECVTAACKAFSLANAKGKGVDELVIKSLDD
jgi:hypothetical protein